MSIFYMQRDRGGARPPDQLYSCPWSIYLGRLKPPRKAAGQMHLLTVLSHDGARDMRFRQDVQGLLASSGDC